jgi:hypothetical protein
LLDVPFVKAVHVVPLVVATTLGAGTAHADRGSLNANAFDLSGALDRDVAPTGRALEIAIGGGYTQGVGGAGMAGSVEDVTGPGGGIELQLGMRATPAWSISLYGTAARFRRGDSIADGSRAYSTTAGALAVWHSRAARALDPWVSFGAGWRALWLSPASGEATSVHGIEIARIQLGIDYRFTPWFAIAPVIGVSASVFVVEHAAMMTSLSAVHDNRFNLYGFTGVLGRFDIGG